MKLKTNVIPVTCALSFSIPAFTSVASITGEGVFIYDHNNIRIGDGNYAYRLKW